jgi:hypothetical protein
VRILIIRSPPEVFGWPFPCDLSFITGSPAVTLRQAAG